MLALKEIIEQPQLLRERIRPFLIAFGLTGGVALLFAIAPRLFFPSYVSSMEMNALQGSNLGEFLAPILANLEEMRVAIFTADAWRSFFIVLIGALLLLFYSRGTLKSRWLVTLVALLCLVDMWQVNKRYLNDDMFVEKSKREQAFKPTQTDSYILQDKSLDYRVLNLASNTFNENETSYWHKSVGGYHAAKLRRYQELIETHIADEMQSIYQEVADNFGDMTKVEGATFPVVNMLNTRWFIISDTLAQQNPDALGNAWFVDSLTYVATADQEMKFLDTFNPATHAVADAKFKEALGEASAKQPGDTIRETTYAPNKLTYHTHSAKGGVAVFSEIYFPWGWTATIDGKEAPIGRVDYVLRALRLPAGDHTVVFTFDPQEVHTTDNVAKASIAAIFVGLIAAGAFASMRRKGSKKEAETKA